MGIIFLAFLIAGAVLIHQNKDYLPYDEDGEYTTKFGVGVFLLCLAFIILMVIGCAMCCAGSCAMFGFASRSAKKKEEGEEQPQVVRFQIFLWC